MCIRVNLISRRKIELRKHVHTISSTTQPTAILPDSQGHTLASRKTIVVPVDPEYPLACEPQPIHAL